MPVVPAKCRACGLAFAVNMPFGGPLVTFTGNSTNCPRCGEEADLADYRTDAQGNVSFLRSAYSIFAQPGVTHDDVWRAATITQRARPGETPPEEVVASVAAINPAFRQLGNLLKPTNPSEFWAMMAVLVPLLLWLAQHFTGRPPEITQTIVNQVINQTIIYQTPGP